MPDKEIRELPFSIYESAPIKPKEKFDRMFFIERKTLLENFPMHWHKWIELELIVKGSGKQVIDGVEYELSPGSIYLLFPTNTHEVFPDPTLELISFSFDYTFIPSSIFPFLSKQHDAIVTKLDTNTLKKLLTISDLMFEEFMGNSTYKNENIASYCSILLIDFFVKSGFAKEENDLFVSPKRQMAKILDYIQQNYSNSPTLTQISTAFHFNTSYFSSFFKKHMGVTYKNYLNEVKISNAKKLFLENKLSVIDVALSCGFNSMSNFSNTFKTLTGTSPTEFLKTKGIKKL